MFHFICFLQCSSGMRNCGRGERAFYSSKSNDFLKLRLVHFASQTRAGHDRSSFPSSCSCLIAFVSLHFICFDIWEDISHKMMREKDKTKKNARRQMGKKWMKFYGVVLSIASHSLFIRLRILLITKNKCVVKSVPSTCIWNRQQHIESTLDIIFDEMRCVTELTMTLELSS